MSREDQPWQAGVSEGMPFHKSIDVAKCGGATVWRRMLVCVTCLIMKKCVICDCVNQCASFLQTPLEGVGGRFARRGGRDQEGPGRDGTRTTVGTPSWTDMEMAHDDVIR